MLQNINSEKSCAIETKLILKKIVFYGFHVYTEKCNNVMRKRKILWETSIYIEKALNNNDIFNLY